MNQLKTVCVIHTDWVHLPTSLTCSLADMWLVMVTPTIFNDIHRRI